MLHAARRRIDLIEGLMTVASPFSDWSDVGRFFPIFAAKHIDARLAADMKTTVDLPDELMRAVKVRAAQEGRKLKAVMADIVERGLAADPAAGVQPPGRVLLPLVECAHEARLNEEMTPEHVATALEREEPETSRRAQ